MWCWLTSAPSGIVASIIRATIFFGTDAFTDETMASVDLIGWSIIETSVYIITCCLPFLRPLASHYTPAWLKKAVRVPYTSYGSHGGGGAASSKGLSGIHKSTAFSHSQHYNRKDGGEDVVELTGAGGREEERYERGRVEMVELGSAPSSPGGLGVTTNISGGIKYTGR